jgi:hypothetical protein
MVYPRKQAISQDCPISLLWQEGGFAPGGHQSHQARQISRFPISKPRKSTRSHEPGMPHLYQMLFLFILKGAKFRLSSLVYYLYKTTAFGSE